MDLTSAQISELILSRLYDLAKEQGAATYFSFNDVAAELGLADQTRIFNIVRLLENRGLVRAAHTLGASHGAITGEGALLVERGGDTGVIGTYTGFTRQQHLSTSSRGAAPARRTAQPASRSVFVVHGHDNEMKEAVARFVESLGLKAIILHEQASRNRTIIEKLAAYSDVEFAVVLLSPDDVGRSMLESDDRPRARQNVIFEWGYFYGAIGRERVCAIHRGVELPSDVSGVLYIGFDHAGAWKEDLRQELQAAGFDLR